MDYRFFNQGLWTLSRREIARVIRLWRQTVFPSVVTTVLYFAIFGFVLGSRVGLVDGVAYPLFVAPGLVMLSVTVNSYSNAAFSTYIEKFHGAIEEVLASPLSDHQIIVGFLLGGLFRGFVCSILVLLMCFVFLGYQLHHPFLFVLAGLLTACMFSLMGVANGLVATGFDGLNVVATLILSPLTMLGGVFYSVNMLPPFWQSIAWFNPLLYIGNLYRYAMLGITNIDPNLVFIVLLVNIVLLYALSLFIMRRTTYVRQ
ncbi:ABC transporter permease [Candidatus Comchoanobacter bicostacola]|uniref:Transport permease protein n=1 Tax=Candidatus Comchoanobacter bicostacola TaxID=2919598 RepID=A0ABY5DKQ8_9GAMM|nr:ABC transporter permease [Candidatus Comchoanobacter bicostacola]UTC24572.1 ABC transporter permease [Candidatus Comchoanobacter bicostacola]